MFDTEAFGREYRHTLHTVPGAEKSHQDKYEKSRLWTCEKEEWSKRQREAAAILRAAGADEDAPTPDAGTSHSYAEEVRQQDRRALKGLLPNDPVWQAIAAERATPRPRLAPG